MTTPSHRPLSRRVEYALLFLCVGLAAVIPLRNGWCKWPDAYVDFGIDAYGAWRVLEGDLLQRDIANIFGPLSCHFNAAMFAIFGTSLGTLYVVNGALYLLLIFSLFSIFRRFAGFPASLLACAWVTAALAFNQLVGTGNYNFIAPYTHVVTHGLVLSAVALLLTVKMLEAPDARWLGVAAGAAFGATALTKPEIFLALSLALSLLLLLRRQDWTWRNLLLFLAGTSSLPIGFCLFFRIRGDWQLAADNLLTPFSTLLGELHHRDVGRLPLYQYILGTDDVGQRLSNSLQAFCLVVGVSALAWLADHRLSGRVDSKSTQWLARMSVCTIGFLAMYSTPMFFKLPSATLLVLALAMAYFVWAWRKQRNRQAAVALAVGTLGGGILLKTLLNVRYEHYGFAVDFVAFAFLLATAWDRFQAHGLVLRPLLLGAAIAVAIKLPTLAHENFWRHKTEVVQFGPDKLLTYAGDRSLADTVNLVLKRVPPGATLSVLPEGCIINYLARRRMSVRETVLLPFTFGMRGEEGPLEEFRTSPPDFVILRNRDVREFGKTGFGIDYAETLFAWLEANYVKRDQYGTIPFDGNKTGMILYERSGR